MRKVFNIKKAFIFIFSAILLHVTYFSWVDGSYAQSSRGVEKAQLLNVEFKGGLFSIHAEEIPLGEVLAEIEKQSGFVISIEESLKSRPVTLSFPRLNIIRTLEAITNAAGLAGYGISYKPGDIPGRIGQWVVNKIALADKGGESITQQKIIPPDNQRVEKKTIKAPAAIKKSKIIEKEPFFDKRLNRYVEVAKGEVIVRFPKGITKEQIEKFHKEKDTQTLKGYEKISAIRLKIPATESVQEFVEKYSIDGKQAYIEPVFLAGQQAIQVNDPSFMHQWAIPQIQADKVWEINNGNPDVIVAVIDTGIDVVHPDLKNKVVQGIDIVNGSSNGLDDNGHGTHVAGVIAAESNNSIGIAGISWKSKLMPVKVITASGEGAYSDLIEGIIYAVDHGARVLNLSLGGYSYSQSLADAIEYAHSNRAVIVAAGGNENTDVQLYPAAYPNVIGVSATDPSDIRWSSANFGNYVKLSAPGVGILSTQKDNAYASATGTSASTAHVSGVAALILSKNPDFSNTQVENILYETAEDLGDKGWDNFYGFGRVNALKAIEKAGIEVHDVAVTGIKIEPETFKVGEATKIIVTVENQGTFVEKGLVINVYINETLIGQSIITTPLNPDANVDVSFDWTPSSVTEQTLKVKGVVESVKGETDIADNEKITEFSKTETNGTVTIKYSTTVHQWITRQAVKFLEGKVDSIILNEIAETTIVDLLSAGAKAEDKSTLLVPLVIGYEDYHECGKGGYEDVPFRWLRHFYRPIDERGYYLKLAEASLIDPFDCTTIENPVEDIYLLNYLDGGEFFLNSILWGFDNSVNNYDFMDAVNHYKAGRKGSAYYALGHVLHLIEDASLPEHTHLELHGEPFQNNYEAYLSSLIASEFSVMPDFIKAALDKNGTIVTFDSFDAYISELAKRSYYLNRYPADLSDTSKKGAQLGKLGDMFPDIAFYDFDGDFILEWVSPSIGRLGSTWWETISEPSISGENSGRYYIEQSNLTGAIPRMYKTFYDDFYDPYYNTPPQNYETDDNTLGIKYVYVNNNSGFTLAQRYAIDLIPLAIRHVAGAIMLFWQTTHPPTVSSFSVTPSSLILGNAFTTTYCVTDDVGLKQVELWRATDTNGDDQPDWPTTYIQSPTVLSGQTSYCGVFSDTPQTAGTYWYGIHVVNNAGNWNDEQNSNTGGSPGDFGPLQVTVTFGTPSDTTGPTTSNLIVTPNPTNGATLIDVQATVSDVGSGNSNITAAELFIDSIGANGSGYLFFAVDGSFNSPTEQVKAIYSISTWVAGTTRTIYVHGKDAAGNWGPFQSVGVSVTSAPANKPDLRPYTPSGWSSPVIIRTSQGCSLTNCSPSNSFLDTDTIYVNWAVLNDSSIDITNNFVGKVYVDGIEKRSWTNNPLQGWYWWAWWDWSIGTFNVGPHEILLSIDVSNSVSESNEGNNEYRFTFNVTGTTGNQWPIIYSSYTSSVTSISAILNGNVNPNGLPTTAWFEWGLTPSSYFGNTTQPPSSLGNSTNAVSYYAPISGLAPNTTYYYRAVAQNSNGISYEAQRTFTTQSTTPTPESFTDINAPLAGVFYGSVAWGDYDNDGDLDILLTGSGVSKIYRNDAGNFVDINASLIGINNSAVAWGDYDNDGDLDILLTGGANTAKVYRNDNGNFVDIAALIMGGYAGSVAWGDYDNDGDLDILVTGEAGSNNYISKIYQNYGGTFIDISAPLTGVWWSSVGWGDYDNDGDSDILLTGATTASGNPISKIYRNDGGSFVDISANLIGVWGGSATWGDYDNDRDLDILVCAAGGKNSKIYRNDNGNFVDISAILVGVDNCAAAWGDYDNDGDLDILLAGLGNGSSSISKIYRNDNGSFVDISANLVGVWGSSVAWGDYDNDGDLDILLTGTPGSGSVSKVYRNNINFVNTAPTAPSNLASSVTGDSVTLGWNKSTDGQTAQNALTYNLRIGTTSGGVQKVSPMANVTTSYRKIPKLGNTNHVNLWTIENLPAGTYYWSVQAIDNAFAGSAFATEQSFTIYPPDTTAPTDGTLTATAGDTQVSLSWSGFSDSGNGIASYTLVYSTSGTQSSCSSGTQIYSGSSTSYTHSSLSNGTTYYYRLCATDNAGNISSGSTVTAIPSAGVITLTTEASRYWAIALDSANVYWTDVGNNAIKKISKNGGIVTTLASGIPSALAITVYGNYVYWSENASTGSGYIKMVSVGGGTVYTIANSNTWGYYNGIRGLAVDSSGVYWAVSGNNSSGTDGAIMKLSGVPVDNPALLALTAPTILANGLINAKGIAIDNNDVYWIEPYTAVKKVNKNGGSVTILTSGSVEYSGIAVDATNVYFGVWNGNIYKVPLGGGSSTNIGGGMSSDFIAIDSNYVYYTNVWGGSVGKVSKDGAGSGILYSGEYGGSWGIAVDETAIYWTTCPTCYAPSTGAVKKITKDLNSDTTPPTADIFSINSNATYTNSTSVILTLSASDSSGVSQMCISNTTSCSSWEAYATSKLWTLSSGDGTKAIYVWFKDSVGNANTSPYSNSIILDTAVPTDGTLTATAENSQITLTWSGFSDSTSGISSYKLVYSTSSVPAFCAEGTALPITGNSYTHRGLTNGTTYYYRFCAIDNAGNPSFGTTAYATPVAPDGVSIPPSDTGITGVEREDGGSDNNNIDSTTNKPRIDITYNFGIVIKDPSGNQPQYARFYMTNRSNPAASDFYSIDLTCTGSWAYGATCNYATLLGPAANHKYYFEAKLADGSILRYPLTGEISGPVVELLSGYNMVSIPRDTNGANMDSSTAFGNTQTYKWVSTGLTGSANKGSYVLVDSNNPVKPGEGYFTMKGDGITTLPEHGTYADTLSPTYEITLKPGWNMVSNPYGGNVMLSAVQVQKGSGAAVSWTDATASGYVVNAIYYYKGSDWGSAYTFESAGGSPDAILVPWFGYWVYLNKNDDTYKLVITRP